MFNNPRIQKDIYRKWMVLAIFSIVNGILIVLAIGFILSGVLDSTADVLQVWSRGAWQGSTHWSAKLSKHMAEFSVFPQAPVAYHP